MKVESYLISSTLIAIGQEAHPKFASIVKSQKISPADCELVEIMPQKVLATHEFIFGKGCESAIIPGTRGGWHS